jgi:thiol-disulfide isomerase/thioredoxin
MYVISKNPLKDFDETILNKGYETYDAERKGLIDSINYYLEKPIKASDDSLHLKDLYKKRKNLFPQETETFYTAYDCKLIDSIYQEPKSDILKLFLLERGKNSFEQSYPQILQNTKTGWCKKLVSEELAEATVKQKKINALLASSSAINDTAYFIGSPLKKLPFGARLYQLDSIKNIDTLIKNLQLKFRNKALIIDFWATWCAPCLSDLPYSKKLHEANKDLPVEYVYICTNSASNVGLWEKAIADIRLPGTHIFMDEKIVEALKSSFNNAGSGFPTYVVIDRDGNFRPKVIERMQFLNRDNLKQIIGSEENK